MRISEQHMVFNFNYINKPLYQIYQVSSKKNYYKFSICISRLLNIFIFLLTTVLLFSGLCSARPQYYYSGEIFSEIIVIVTLPQEATTMATEEEEDTMEEEEHRLAEDLTTLSVTN